MNRHTRRAANKSELGKTLGEFSGLGDKIQLYLANAQELQSQLENVTELLLRSEQELAALRSTLVEQQQMYRCMFARGMGVSVDAVLSMESEIQQELNRGDQDAVKTARPDSEA